jgi:hypothetical protein
MDRMQDHPLFSHPQVEEILTRAGYSQHQIAALLEDLPDPFDPERDKDILGRHGISLGGVMDRLGSSP